VRLTDILDELQEAFEDAAAASPCVLVMDDLDELTLSFDGEGISASSSHTHKTNPAAVYQAKVIADAVTSLWHAATTGTASIALIATCREKASLHSSIKSCILFDRVFDVPTLSSSDKIIAVLECSEWKGGPMVHGAFDEAAFSKATDGWRAGDVVRLAQRVHHRLRTLGMGMESVSSVPDEELIVFILMGQLSATVDDSTPTLS